MTRCGQWDCGLWMPRFPRHEEEEKGDVKDKDTEDSDEQKEKDNETVDDEVNIESDAFSSQIMIMTELRNFCRGFS